MLGVACVDDGDGGTIFTADDLRLMLAVDAYAAMAAIQHPLQGELRHDAALLGRLYDQFFAKESGARCFRERLRPCASAVNDGR